MTDIQQFLSAGTLTKDVKGQPISALPLVFFDVETTGLFPSLGHRICEVALVRVTGGKIETNFSSLVNPQRDLDAQAFAINGISRELLWGAPLFAEIAVPLMDRLNGAVLIAHNAPFDSAFLSAELELLGRPTPLNPVLDTLVLARRLLRRASYSLRALAADLGLHPPTHRAMSDVLALRGLFEYLVELMKPLGIVTLGDALRFQRGLLPGQPDIAAPPLVDRAINEGRKLRIVYSSRTSAGPIERIVMPLDLTQEQSGVYLRAFCYLRNDVRSFALKKIETIDLA